MGQGIMMRDEDIVNNSSILLEEPTANATLGSLRETQVTKRPTFPCSKRGKNNNNTANIRVFTAKEMEWDMESACY